MVWCVFLLGLVVFAVNFYIYASSRIYIYDTIAAVPSAQVVLIPGAAVLKGGQLSSIFRDRVDTAIELYVAGKVSKILVSGDNSTVSYNEVNPVRLYLLNAGIPDEDIFLDHAGFDTYSTMYRAREIFRVESVIISTQSFHLPRSVFIARGLGIKAHGLNADVGNVLAKNYVREALANELAVFELLTKRKPKFLGEKIPITGDGRLQP